MAMIEVEELRKNYGSFRALLGISFTVDRGEILGFLGPNGAGKSTTMKILTGILNPSGGRAVVMGHDVLENSIEVRRNIGYLPENNPLYEDLTVREYLRFCGKLRSMGGGRLSERIREVVDQTGLGPKYRAPIKTLSKGFRQRVGIAQALLNEPGIIILDEPTVGLDPNQVIEVRSLIRDVGRERTVIICSHILSEVEATCGRVVIIHEGQIVGNGAPKELAQELQANNYYEVTALAGAEALCPVVESAPGVSGVEVVSETGGSCTVRFEAGISNAAPAVVEVLAGSGIKVESLVPRRASLEDVFRALTPVTGGETS